MIDHLIESINPSSKTTYQLAELDNSASLERKLAASHSRFLVWRKSPIQTRCEKIQQLSLILGANKENLANTLAREVGKPIRQARSEIEKCRALCDFFAKSGAGIHPETSKIINGQLNIIRQEPLGPILGVMPWNFPYWQSMRFVIPTILAGNTVLLKIAKNASGCAIELKKCFEEAGLNRGEVEVVFTTYKQTRRLLADSRIKGLSFTGSSQTGRCLARTAGEHIKKTVLELGGSDPYIILKDADLERAVDECVESRLTNNGQSCIAAKRFIVDRSNYDDFVELFMEHCKQKVVSDPMYEETDIGPLAKKSMRKTLERQVRESAMLGAKNVYSGSTDIGNGFYHPIMVFKDVPLNSPLMKEETFGPVAAIVPVRNETEAIQIANSSRYGLGSAIFTKDKNLGMSIAKELESGMVAINRAVRSHWELPFGGVKDSGIGSELGASGVESFTNNKVIMTGSLKAI